MALTPVEETAWHHHSEVTDNIFGLTGAITIHLKRPEETIDIQPGSRCEILPGRQHKVCNTSLDQGASYLLIQGVGRYDFLTKNNSGP